MHFRKQNSSLIPGNQGWSNFFENVSYERVSINDNNNHSNERRGNAAKMQGVALMQGDGLDRISLSGTGVQQKAAQPQMTMVNSLMKSIP